MANHVPTVIHGQKFNLKAESSIGIDSWEHIVEVQPESVQQNWLGINNNFVDFVIKKKDIDRINSVKLRLNLNNSAGTSISILPTSFLVDRYQIIVGDRAMVDEVFSTAAFMDIITLLYGENEMVKAAEMQGFNSVTLAPTTTLAAAASATHYVDLPSFLNQTRPHYGIWPDKATITFRVWFASTGSYYISGTAGLNITYAALQVTGKKGPHSNDEADSDILAYRSQGVLDYKYLAHRTRIIKLTSKTAGQVDRIKLENVMGEVMWFTVLFRNENATGADIINFLPIRSAQIETQTSTNILGMNDIPETVIRNIQMNAWFKNCSAIHKLKAYVWSWTPDPVTCYWTGAKLGGNSQFMGDHYLAWKPDLTQTYQVDIICYAYQILRIFLNGNVEVNPLT
jgi:hypothetical protein